MTDRCPRCFGELTEDDTWVCPHCGFTLRTPAVSKVGLLFMLLGLFLLGAYVIGPDQVGLTSGLIPTDLVKLMEADFALMVAGVLGFGMLLIAAGALAVRRARNRTVPV